MHNRIQRPLIILEVTVAHERSVEPWLREKLQAILRNNCLLSTEEQLSELVSQPTGRIPLDLVNIGHACGRHGNREGVSTLCVSGRSMHGQLGGQAAPLAVGSGGCRL